MEPPPRTGTPTEQILAAAHTHHTLVLADATQAAGWLPLDATRFDAMVCSAYKWLMAPRGLSLAYLSPALRTRLRPTNAGPMADATRAFDLSPNWFAAVAGPALEVPHRAIANSDGGGGDETPRRPPDPHDAPTPGLGRGGIDASAAGRTDHPTFTGRSPHARGARCPTPA